MSFRSVLKTVASWGDGFGLPGARGDGTPFAGASVLNRDVSAWRTTRRSADAELLPAIEKLVGRSRDMDRNSGVAHGGIQTICDNVVGTGLRLSARPDYKVLKKDKEWAAEWSRLVQSYFHQWWWTTRCHAGDTMTGDQMTMQQFRAGLLSGEWLALPLWIPDRGDGYSTKIQTVDTDRLSNPNGASDTFRMRGGIEFDAYGAPIFYNIRSSHPNDPFLSSATFATWERVPRRTPFGRAMVLHGFDPERTGQSRGRPMLSAVLSQFKNIDRYQAAEIQAAVLNAMIAMTIETPLGHEDILELFNRDHAAYLAARERHAVELEAGSMMPLFPGDKANAFLPTRPAAQFGVFMENVLRMIAVGMDIPYELLAKDFSKTSYSSARQSMLEAWRSFNRRRDWLATQWADPIYDLFLEELVNDGRIEAPGFYDNRAAYTRCKWLGPGRGWVDPVKEGDAAVLRMKARLSTLEDECAEQGKDWNEVLEQLAVEQMELERLGLNSALPDPSAQPYATDAPPPPAQQPPAQPAAAGD